MLIHLRICWLESVGSGNLSCYNGVTVMIMMIWRVLADRVVSLWLVIVSPRCWNGHWNGGCWDLMTATDNNEWCTPIVTDHSEWGDSDDIMITPFRMGLATIIHNPGTGIVGPTKSLGILPAISVLGIIMCSLTLKICFAFSSCHLVLESSSVSG